MRNTESEATPEITPETVRHTARLARLRIDDADLPLLAAQLGRIAGFFEAIAGAEGESAQESTVERGEAFARPSRPDEPADAADPRLRELAPDLRHDLVAVPLVIDREGRDG